MQKSTFLSKLPSIKHGDKDSITYDDLLVAPYLKKKPKRFSIINAENNFEQEDESE